METVKQCREDGYRGKLKKENEDDDVAGDGKRDIEEWINGDRRGERKDNTRNGGRRRTDRVVSGPGYPGSSLFSSFGRVKTGSDSVLSRKQGRVEACTVYSTYSEAAVPF